MGVNGLWQLLNPVARPVALETLEQRRLAVDASIWIYQFQMATRDKKTGNVIQGAHIMGTFRRIMKLLFHGIKPVFVFDGEAPALKRRTLEGRRRRKEGAGQNLQRTAKALLSAQLRAHLAKEEARKEKARAERQGVPAPGDTGEEIGEDVVYLEDLEAEAPRTRRKSTPAAHETRESILPPSPAKKYVPKDQYALPKIAGPLESRAKASDIRIATPQEEQDFLDELRPDFFDTEEFASLSTELKYEIIGEQRLKSRQVNHRRVRQMKSLPTALDFSQSQIANLVERNAYTQKLLEVTDELGSAKILVPTRVAGERSKVYTLVKQDPSKGTGYVLGVQNPELGKTDPIVIDSTTSDGSTAGTDSDDMEEVLTEQVRDKTPPLDPEVRRAAAMEAIQARYGPSMPGAEFDPLLDATPASQSQTQLFRKQVAHNRPTDDSRQTNGAAQQASAGFEFPEEEEDPALQEALIESALLAKISEAVRARQEARQAETARAASARLDDSDDELEYVDVTAQDPPSTGTVQAAPAKPPSVLQISSDDEGSFEEVEIAHSSRPTETTQQANVFSTPLAAPIELAVESSAAPSVKYETKQHARKSLMETVLHSDDEGSDLDEMEEVPIITSSTRKEAIGLTNSARMQAQRPFAMPIAPQTPPRPEQRGKLGSPALSPSPEVQSPQSVEADVVARDYAADAEPEPVPIVHEGSGKKEAVEIVGQVTANGAVELEPTLPDATSNAEHEPARSLQETTTIKAPYNMDEQTRMVDQAALPTNDTRSQPLDEPPTLGNHFMLGDSLMPASDDESLPPLPPLPPLPDDAVPEQQLGAQEMQQAQATVAQTKLDDDEEFFEWEKSPTPSPRRPSEDSALFKPTASGDEFDFDAEEELEMIRNYEREQAQYADMLSQLKNRKIEDMLNEAKNDVDKLVAQRNAEQRNAEGITRTMAADIQEMLMLFGIPYIVAPQEAEAECADMLTRELVDGIVTDDSDVFLFGGTRVYRHMFNDNKVVECYLMTDLERELGLDRGKLVQLAYLLGGDYADGLKGIGPVQGRELLAEFDSDDGIQEFKAWWAKVQEGRDDKVDTSSPFRRRFKNSHKKLVIDDNWPNPEVAKTYLKPVVSRNDEPFEWGGIDLDGLRLFLQRMLTWNNEKTSELLLPLIKRQQARASGQLKHQSFLSDYFDVSAGTGTFRNRVRAGYENKRLQSVLKAHRQRMRAVNSQDEDEEDEEGDLSPKEGDSPAPPPAPARKRSHSTSAVSSASTNKGKRKATPGEQEQQESGGEEPTDLPAPKKRRARPAKRTAVMRKKDQQARKAVRAAARGGELSSDDEEDEPGRPTIASLPRPKRKATKRPTREVVSSSDDLE
ncbi:DNA repair protein rad2 [Microbotryomycetes sp. JL221]|nr:DNA repair protein rad2 [Microbotryomycetes sp. JL221]